MSTSPAVETPYWSAWQPYWSAWLLANPTWMTPLALLIDRYSAQAHRYVRWLEFERNIRLYEHRVMVSERMEEERESKRRLWDVIAAEDDDPQGDDPGNDPVFAAAHCREVSPALGSGDGRIKYKAHF